MSKYEKYIRTIPKRFKPTENPVLNAFIRAFSEADEEAVTQINNTKAQLFVRTAEGQNLDKLANSLGVSRPTSLGLSDEKFQELIPNLSLKAKQIRKTLYDTADVFWGALFTRANIQSNNAEPYNVSPGDSLKIKIDNGGEQVIKVLVDEIAIPGAATAEELALIFERINNATTSVIEDTTSGDVYLNIRTNTPGALGAVEIIESSIIDSSKLDFDLGKTKLIQQDQRFIIYEVTPNVLTIEIPAILPSLRRTLKGSHHWHEDATLEGPIAPDNGIWEGSFLFDPSGSDTSYTVSGQQAKLEENLLKGNVYTKVTVDDTSAWEADSGLLIFGWGTDSEEQPVRFRGVPNEKTILLDPSYVFKNNQLIDSYVNVLVDQRTLQPAKTGEDLAIYLTSPSAAREVVEDILETLVAAGVLVNFVILAPEFKYLIDNPYLAGDDAPVSD